MDLNKPIRTRIAPSPTGKMHIGTARVALFNKLFALHYGGTYCVRIEDTDKERSSAENVAFLEDALAWLGLEPDEDYVIQSAAIVDHQAAAERLLEAELAYEDENGVVRFKVPEGRTGWQDMIQGHILVEHKQLEDFALLRSDGSPTYHLSVVVDDAAMNITHVIRGDDHINNTPKQILLYHALFKCGWLKEDFVPEFAHVSMVLGEDGQKMSKRHGATSVQEFREAGFLPNAVQHYLMMLSWLAGDNLEPLTLQSAGEQFDIKAVKKSPATFDFEKLKHLNGLYLKNLEHSAVLDALVAYANHHGEKVNETGAARIMTALDAFLQRSQTLAEVWENAEPFIMEPPFALNDDAKIEYLKGESHVKALATEFADATWDPALLHTIVKDYVKDNELKFPEVGKPLRVALIGQLQGPGLDVILNALGRDESLKRLQLQAA